jgi:SHS2 domain-containing protein
MTPYRIIDHTADGGLLIEAPDAAALFADAALALVDQVVDRQTVQDRDQRTLAVDGAEWTDLMVNWLREVLYLINGRQWLVSKVKILTVAETRVTARLHGEGFAPRRHGLRGEIKAVTYHQARVENGAGRWQARIILDL